MKKLIKILFFGLIGCPTIFAQVLGNANSHNSQRTNSNENDHPKIGLEVHLNSDSRIFQAEVLYNAKPTHYLAIFATTQEAETVEDVDRFMNQRLESFKAVLKNAGVGEGQIFSDFVSLVPKYDVLAEKKKRSKTANEVPIGFQLKKNVHISFTDGKLLDKIISAAATAEIYDLAKVEVSVSDVAKIHAEMRVEAAKIIKEKTEFTTTLGLKLTPLSMGDNFEAYYPDENYEKYSASITDFSDVQQQQSYQKGKMSIKYASKSATVYYNRLPYDQFDSVINPDFAEPPIQFHYKLSVNYRVASPELIEQQKASEKLQAEKYELARKDEIEIRKLQAQNPPKTCCDGKN